MNKVKFKTKQNKTNSFTSHPSPQVQPVLTTAALYDHEPVAGISDAFLLHGSELHLYNKININNIGDTQHLLCSHHH